MLIYKCFWCNYKTYFGRKWIHSVVCPCFSNVPMWAVRLLWDPWSEQVRHWFHSLHQQFCPLPTRWSLVTACLLHATIQLIPGHHSPASDLLLESLLSMVPATWVGTSPSHVSCLLRPLHHWCSCAQWTGNMDLSQGARVVAITDTRANPSGFKVTIVLSSLGRKSNRKSNRSPFTTCLIKSSTEGRRQITCKS